MPASMNATRSSFRSGRKGLARFPAVAASLVVGLVAAGLGGAVRTHAAEPAAAEPFRVAFTSSMFTEINENDARASVKVWAQTVAKERGIAAVPDALIAKDAAAMTQILRAGQVDAVGLQTDEFAAVSREVAFAHVFIAMLGGKLTEEYVVVVPRDSAVESLAQLQGRELLLFKSPRTCLAAPWLDTELRQHGQPAAGRFFGRIQRTAKLSRAILPVFFRQADAGLVTRRGFETMSELNPQIGRQLRVVAASPPVVPAVFAIRAGFQSASLPAIIASLRELHASPAGQQVLTVFQCDRLVEASPDELADSLALLAAHARADAAEAAQPAPTGKPR